MLGNSESRGAIEDNYMILRYSTSNIESGLYVNPVGHMKEELRRLIQKHFGFLETEHGFTVLAEKYWPEAFGNWYMLYSLPGIIDIEVVNDRSIVLVDFIQAGRTSSSTGLVYLIAMLADKPELHRQFLAREGSQSIKVQIEQSATLLRSHIRDILALFSNNDEAVISAQKKKFNDVLGVMSLEEITQKMQHQRKMLPENLSRFIEGKLSVDSLIEQIDTRVVFDLSEAPDQRYMKALSFISLEEEIKQKIEFKKTHLLNQLKSFLSNKLSVSELSNWAALILMLKTFVIAGDEKGPISTILTLLASPTTEAEINELSVQTYLRMLNSEEI